MQYLLLLLFLSKQFNIQPYLCNRCHDLLILSISLGNITALKIKNFDYRCIIRRFGQSEAINLLKNIDLTERGETL